MKCSEIIHSLEQLAPSHYACEWDNIGLLAGRMDKNVERIFIALDATDEMIQQAFEFKADLLITHHPLIFKPLKKITDQDFITRRIMKLIQLDMCYYAMHTNFDAAPGCMADLAAERLDLYDCIPLSEETGIGKIGFLKNPVNLGELGDFVKVKFGLPYAVIYGNHREDTPITRVAVSPGSGSSMVEDAIRSGAQVLITGDIGHHTGIDAVARKLSIIDGGHYGLEHIFMEFMKDYLTHTFGSKIAVGTADIVFPSSVR